MSLDRRLLLVYLLTSGVNWQEISVETVVRRLMLCGCFLSVHAGGELPISRCGALLLQGSFLAGIASRSSLETRRASELTRL